MFNARYWAPRYWAGRYWTPVGLDSPEGYYWAGYWNKDYWTRTYWAKRADTNPCVAEVTAGLSASTGITFGSPTVSLTNDLTATVTTGLTVATTIGLNATPSMEFADAFIASAPVELACATTVTIAATPVLGFAAGAGTGYYWAGRYWAARYWAPRYWETQIEFEAVQTTGLTAAATVTIAATPAQVLEASILAGLTVDTGIAFTGSVGYPNPVYTAPGHKKKRNYIVRGRKYLNITDEELIQILAQEARDIAREDIKVSFKGKKPHPISRDLYEGIKGKLTPEDIDEEEAFLLL